MNIRRLLLWLTMIVCAALAVAAFGYPMMVIQPFRAQDPGTLAFALEVRQWGPFLAPVFAGIAAVCLVWLWRKGRIWTRIVSALLVALGIAGAALTRVNVFERMFAPVPEVRTESAADSKLEADDMVLAVKISDAPRAYGVRMMAYHHIVNDWLAGVPLVGTY
jgi:hypothetical protein